MFSDRLLDTNYRSVDQYLIKAQSRALPMLPSAAQQLRLRGFFSW